MKDIETNLKEIEQILRNKLNEHADNSLEASDLLNLIMRVGHFEREVESIIERSKGHLYHSVPKASLKKYAQSCHFQEFKIKGVPASQLVYLEVKGWVLVSLYEKKGSFFLEIYEERPDFKIDLSSINFEDYRLDMFSNVELQRPTNKFLHFQTVKELTSFIENQLPAFVPIEKKKSWFAQLRNKQAQ